MKRVIFIISCITFLTNAEAQYTMQKKTGDFTEIELSGSSKVNLYQSDSNYITIPSTDSLVKNSHAHIKAGVLYITSGFKGDVHVKNIVAIRVTDASSLTSKDTLRANTLTVTASDAGRINILVNAKGIVAHSKDAGKIILTGSANALDAKATDASLISGFGLKTGTVKAVASDGSSEEVWSINSIDATATDGSTINIKGSPKEKNTSATDGGSVTMDDSGEQTAPEYGRHSAGSVLDKDST